MTRIVRRPALPRVAWALEQQGVHPLLAQLYAGRGVREASDLATTLDQLIPPDALKGLPDAATLLADAIEADARILIVADYDCDGATACAVGIRALRAMGARVDYLVPDRITYGYGLTPEIVALGASREPDLIVTVDNGIASIDGVAAARALGIATLITDHHLPGDALPDADAIVNPNQPGCDFPSKALAGVGVMFYVMLALRAELRTRGHFAETREPNLAALLDLVALGTVADVVALDRNNRILVAQGLARIRDGRLQQGVRALFRAAGRDAAKASSFDLGFLIGPRINAAGRLSDMSIGIECLITDDPSRALNLAQELNALNLARRDIESDMQARAETLLAELDTAPEQAGVAMFDPEWHPGVVGILASRIKDKLHRPVIAFARADNGELRGSGRSIPTVHLRDALDLVAKRAPGLLKRFGGHAAAAGLTLAEADYPRFRELFADVIAQLTGGMDLSRELATDGELPEAYFALATVRLIDNEVWGQAFPAPVFEGRFRVEQQRLLKDRHLKLRLRLGRTVIDALRFNCTDPVGDEIHAVFRLAINEFNGRETPQLMLEHFDNLAR